MRKVAFWAGLGLAFAVVVFIALPTSRLPTVEGRYVSKSGLRIAIEGRLRWLGFDYN